jgi:hypothetical protein
VMDHRQLLRRRLDGELLHHAVEGDILYQLRAYPTQVYMEGARRAQ